MDEVSRTDLKLELPQENELTVSERDSVMLGEISPDHEFYDSKSSTETPPSYNQLNYNENLQRFFSSKPLTAPAEFDPLKIEQSTYNANNSADARSTLSPVQCFEGSGGSGSSGNFTSGSQLHMGSVTNTSNTGTGTSSGSLQPVTLTEALLNKHNDEMEKYMLKRHRESRNRSGDKNKKNIDYSGPGHGIKRGGSHSWEKDANKPKHLHTNLLDLQQRDYGDNNPSSSKQLYGRSASAMQANNTLNNRSILSGSRKVNLWPPFSVGLTSSQNSQTVSQSGFVPQTANLFPTFYYIPATAGAATAAPQVNVQPNSSMELQSCEQTAHQALPMQYMTAGLMYPHPSFFYTPHPPTPMMYQPFSFTNLNNSTLSTNDKSSSSSGMFKMVSELIIDNKV